MAVYTDNPDFAASLLASDASVAPTPLDRMDPGLLPLVHTMLRSNEAVFTLSPDPPLPWPHVLVSEYSRGSQYDRLLDLARRSSGTPHGSICFAGSGSGFHGFKARPWAALPGNLHLAVHLAPRQPIDRFEVAFTVLAALSVSDALNQVGGLTEKGGIKWVNDILLGEAKVAGVLAYTQSQGDMVTSAVLGLGINTETTPRVDPTPFVPEVACIQDFAAPGTTGIREKMFRHVLDALANNYERLLVDGFSSLLERYRDRSVIVGREVTVCADRSDGRVEVLAEGRVHAIGDDLELVLEGHPRPIRQGRLVLGGLSDHAGDRESNAGTDLRATHGQNPIRFVT